MPEYRRADTQGGTYFFTVNTHRRRPLLTQASVRLALREGIAKAREHFPFEIQAWVLLPDHLHGIWKLPAGDAEFAKRWGIIKRQVSRRCAAEFHHEEWLSESRYKRAETSIWQRRYWEHCIRGEADLIRHMEYLHWNPVKHGLVKRVADWPYSKFHRYVAQGVYPADWGGDFGREGMKTNSGNELGGWCVGRTLRLLCGGGGQEGGRQARWIKPTIQKHKSISDSEQEGMNMIGKRKNNAKLTPARTLRLLLLLPAVLVLAGCAGEKPATLEEAKDLTYRMSVGGTEFNVPVTYDYSNYAMIFHRKGWPRPAQKRQAVDYLNITALLPDMEPYNERNAAEFDALGNGRKVKAALTHLFRPWDYYFQNAAKRRIPLPENSDVLGMLHYREDWSGRDVYFSHDYPARELTRIVCEGQNDPPPSPSCHVETLYRDRFRLEYWFAQRYLPQWRETDNKLRLLLDQFTLAAALKP